MPNENQRPPAHAAASGGGGPSSIFYLSCLYYVACAAALMFGLHITVSVYNHGLCLVPSGRAWYLVDVQHWLQINTTFWSTVAGYVASGASSAFATASSAGATLTSIRTPALPDGAQCCFYFAVVMIWCPMSVQRVVWPRIFDFKDWLCATAARAGWHYAAVVGCWAFLCLIFWSTKRSTVLVFPLLLLSLLLPPLLFPPPHKAVVV